MAEHRRLSRGALAISALAASCVVFSPTCDSRPRQGVRVQEQKNILALPLEYSSSAYFRPLETGEIATSPDSIYELADGRARVYLARINGDALDSRRLCVEYEKVVEGVTVSRTKYFSKECEGNFRGNAGELDKVLSYNSIKGKWIVIPDKNLDYKENFTEIVEEIAEKKTN